MGWVHSGVREFNSWNLCKPQVLGFLTYKQKYPILNYETFLIVVWYNCIIQYVMYIKVQHKTIYRDIRSIEKLNTQV